MKSYSYLEKASYIVFLITLIFSPLVFISSSYAPLDVSKTIIISFGILISSILCVLYSIFEKKSLLFPKNSLITLSILLIISTIISSLASVNFSKSFLGQGFEVNTTSFLLLMFTAMFLISYLTSKDRDRILYVYACILIPFLILALFHFMRFIFGVDFLDFGILNTLSSTLIGKWYDFGVFTGIIALLSFLSIEFLPLSKSFKILLSILLAISVFILIIVNYKFIWISIAIIILAVNVYQYLNKLPQGNGIKKISSRFSIFAMIVFIVSVLFAWKGDGIAIPLVKALKIEQTDASLSWRPTLDISSDTLKESPLFGAGPNRFVNQYFHFKPLPINQTIFWNYEFSNGFGFFLTSFITQGIVGAILWCLFSIFFIRLGVSALKKAINPVSKFIISSTFFISSFLWLMLLVYFPSHIILFITFVFTGLFLAALILEGMININFVNFKEGSILKKYSFILPIISIIILITWTFVYIKKNVALGYFQGGINFLSLPDNKGLDEAENDFNKALSWDRSDVYYQALSEVNIIKINSLTQQIQTQAQQGAKIPNPDLLKQIGDLVEKAIQYTRNAISIDPTNYYNYLAEARISEIATSFQIKNAYENTKTSYKNAIELNPFNPLLYLNLAKFEDSQKKFDEAQRNVGIALQLKQDYLDAIFFLSQVQVEQGQIKEAITSTQVAIQINPKDPLLFFQLGILEYNNKNYEEAVKSLDKAVELNNQYANARYFLGLALARLNKNQEALVQFEEVLKTNPDNKEITLMISNLRAGKSIFTDDNKSEKRKTLPVREKITDTKVNTVN